MGKNLTLVTAIAFVCATFLMGCPDLNEKSAQVGVLLSADADASKSLAEGLLKAGEVDLETVQALYVDVSMVELIPASEEEPEDEEESEATMLKALKTLKADQIIPLIKDEHPQTLAIIIAHLQPSVASEVLGTLPDEIKSDVALRLANLDKVVAGMVQEIDAIFQDIIKSKEDAITRETDGLSHLADILNQIDGASAELIIDEIEESEPELADQIKQMMFIFDDLVLVDDKGLQKVLRSVETQELALALKAASEEVKMKIYRNMSERASEILREELESLGSVRMKDVTMAQGNITRIVQDMERNGELVISGRGGEEFIG